MLLVLAMTVIAHTMWAQVNLVPKPQKAQWQQGNYVLNGQVEVAYASNDLKPAADYLCRALDQAGVQATAKAGKRGQVCLSRGRGIAKSGYQLQIGKEGVQLKGADYEGVVNGVATLRQMLLLSKNEATIPLATISDAPRFGWRGFHLDCSRHFFTVKEVEELIDLMALYKMNRFHWHLTDDQGWRIEIKKYPKLTEQGGWRKYNNQDSLCLKLAREEDNSDFLLPKDRLKGEGEVSYGGFYTQEDIRQVVAFARQRGIEIVPEIDMPGHFLSAIEQYEGLSCFPEIGWGAVFTTPLCPGKNRMIEFCKDVWKEVLQLFPYEYVHIGGDEVPKDNWERCPDCQRRIKEEGLKDEFELQAWFIHQMEQFLNKNGRKMIGWDEILEGGLSPTATVTWWRTWVPDAVAQVTAQGNDVIYCPGDPFYLSQREQKSDLRSIYEYNLLPDRLSEKQKKHVLGVQANMWCEWIPTRERMLYMFFPRTIAVSELAWTKPELKNYDEFYGRLTDQFAMLHRLHVPYRTPSLDGFYNTNAFVHEGTLRVECKDPLATVRYTTDGSFPDKHSTQYSGPVTVDKTTNFILRTFNPEGRADEMTRADFVKQGYLESVANVPSVISPGLNAAWYEYGGVKCTEVPTAPFKGNYDVADVCIPEGVKGKIGLVITGYLNVPADGIYTFALMSDDGSWLKIDGNMVVDNDRPQSPHEEVCQQALRQGLHYFEVRYFDSNGGMLRLWAFDEQGNRLNPAELYRH